MQRVCAKTVGALTLLLSVLLSACGQVSTQTNGDLTTPNAVAPSIQSPPVAQTVSVGSPATFSVGAIGTDPLGYEWQRNGVSISGAAGPSYTLNATTPQDDGDTFAVIVSNSAGTAQSAPVKLRVMPDAVAPTITTQPGDQSITAGQTATFSVVASGTAPLAYQWQTAGAPIAGATSATYSRAAVTSDANGATFTVVVTNSAGSVRSKPATLSVTPAPIAPTITIQPGDQAIYAGATATFTVTATGTTPLAYQWQKRGAAIVGATGASYTTPIAATSDNGTLFSVVVTNVAGSATSRVATLNVVPVIIAPVITSQPAGQIVVAGATATFSVSATGTAPLSYQWSKGGAPIVGATSASYTTPALTLADNGATFTVLVSNSAGSAQSAAGALTVTQPAVAPAITTQPANHIVPAGSTATFSVVATGTAPLTYQWSKRGTPIAGATSASYTTPVLSLADNGATFTVVVSNVAGSVRSAVGNLTVTPPAFAPSITTQPASQTVAAGSTATFSVVAAGTAPLSYQWSRNGGAIAGATAASYTTATLSIADSGATFSVTVSNSAGSAQSASATLTVTQSNVAPTITTQPANQSVTVGSTATFSVVAAGSAPLGYQWSRNGAAISGATSASYTTPVLTAADNGATFSVVVSNTVGSVTSRTATLVVSTVTGQHPDVVTYKYDNSRTGQNLKETILTPANVTSATFGLLRQLPVDGKVDAQPLYLSGLVVNGATHNVLFVATENDSVYAFDADSGAQLWKVSLIPAGETASDSVNCDNVTPTIGITSTPVIDRSAGAHGTMFVIAMTQTGTTYHHRLHALDVTTGGELLGGPKVISASYQSNNGVVQFNSSQGNEHAAMLLNNGTVYTTWTSHCDHYYYAGWIMSYSEATLQQTAVLNVGINSGGIGPAIWLAGSGPMVDSANNVYLITANGGFEATLDANGFPSMGDFGNSFMRISTTGGVLAVADYFAPFNTAFLSQHDLDLGGGGNLMLPDQVDANGITRHLMIGAGKGGDLYVVNRDSMGHFHTTTNNIWQEIPGIFGNRSVDPLNGTSGIWSTPAYFNGHVYYSAVDNYMMSFSVTKALLSTTPVAKSTVKFAYPGASPSVSANGNSNGIVWAQWNDPTTAVLYALDPVTLAKLYSSADAANSRDKLGPGYKFVVPLVVNGKVFLGTTNSVAVFGLL